MGKRHNQIPGSETDREGRNTLTFANNEEEEKKNAVSKQTGDKQVA
jgi:hypothetical protein